LATATPPSSSLKRKRSFSEGIENRKLKKLSDNLADDMARSLSVLDSTSSSSSTTHSSNHTFNKAFLSNRTSPQRTPSLPKVEHRLHQLAQQAGLAVDDYKLRFDQQGRQLQQAMEQLQQTIHQDSATFDQIKSALHTFLHTAQQVTGEQYAIFLVSLHKANSHHSQQVCRQDVFPEWRSWDGFIQKMITYIQVTGIGRRDDGGWER
jgi:ABC-type transporter Mla subunit MlaD